MLEHIRRKRIAEIVECGDRCFDPASGLLHPPEGAEGGPVSSSAVLCYALGLLELSERSLQGRAEAIVGRAAKEFPTPPGDRAEMIVAGMALLPIWHRHRRVLHADVAGAILGRLGRDVSVVAEGGGPLEGGVCGVPAASLVFAVGAALGDEGLMAGALGALARATDGPLPSAPGVEERAFCLSCLHVARTYGATSPPARETTGRLIRRFWASGFGSEPTGPRAYPALIRALLENGTDAEIPGEPAPTGRLLATVTAYVVTVDRSEIPEEMARRRRSVQPGPARAAFRRSAGCPA